MCKKCAPNGFSWSHGIIFGPYFTQIIKSGAISPSIVCNALYAHIRLLQVPIVFTITVKSIKRLFLCRSSKVVFRRWSLSKDFAHTYLKILPIQFTISSFHFHCFQASCLVHSSLWVYRCMYKCHITWVRELASSTKDTISLASCNTVTYTLKAYS